MASTATNEWARTRKLSQLLVHWPRVLGKYSTMHYVRSSQGLVRVPPIKLSTRSLGGRARYTPYPGYQRSQYKITRYRVLVIIGTEADGLNPCVCRPLTRAPLWNRSPWESSRSRESFQAPLPTAYLVTVGSSYSNSGVLGTWSFCAA